MNMARLRLSLFLIASVAILLSGAAPLGGGPVTADDAAVTSRPSNPEQGIETNATEQIQENDAVNKEDVVKLDQKGPEDDTSKVVTEETPETPSNGDVTKVHPEIVDPKQGDAETVTEATDGKAASETTQSTGDEPKVSTAKAETGVTDAKTDATNAEPTEKTDQAQDATSEAVPVSGKDDNEKVPTSTTTEETPEVTADEEKRPSSAQVATGDVTDAIAISTQDGQAAEANAPKDSAVTDSAVTDSDSDKGQSESFSGWSFFGGGVLAIICTALVVVGRKYYKSKQQAGSNYGGF